MKLYGVKIMLAEFFELYGFDANNLNRVNNNLVTPLTLAIEMNLVDITHLLLLEGANPLVENGHGNTPLSLLTKSKSKFDTSLFNAAVEQVTSSTITEQIGAELSIRGEKYEVTRIISAGECCLIVFEIKSHSTGQLFILKIKQSFGGLELRNYIHFKMYNDLIVINSLNLSNSRYFCAVQGLLQPLIPGILVSDFLIKTNDQKMLHYVMHKTLKALYDLHNIEGCVHGDVLPQNIFWNCEKNNIEFIDFDVLRMKGDLLPLAFEKAIYDDFNRLLLGDKKSKHGFSSFSDIDNVINSLQNEHLKMICKKSLYVTSNDDLTGPHFNKLKSIKMSFAV